MHRDFGCIEQNSRICSNPLCAEKSESYQFESLGLKVYKDVEVVNFRLFDLESPTNNACLRFTPDACRSPIRSLQDHYSYDRVERAYFLMAYRGEGNYEVKSLQGLNEYDFKQERGGAIIAMDKPNTASKLIVVLALGTGKDDFQNTVVFKLSNTAKVSDLKSAINYNLQELDGSSDSVSFLKGENRDDQPLSAVFGSAMKRMDGLSILPGLATLARPKKRTDDCVMIGRSEQSSCGDRISIHEILENKYKAEVNQEVRCEKCKAAVKFEPKLHTPPKNLLLTFPSSHVDRQDIYGFRNGYEFVLQKELVASKEELVYELVAVVIRMAATGRTESGHYFSHCKRKDGWYEFNDRSASRIDKPNLRDAYVLMFRMKH